MTNIIAKYILSEQMDKYSAIDPQSIIERHI